MGAYEQSMKHWKNHRKDKFIQQCSGYGGDGEPKYPEITPEQEKENSERSMSEILDKDHEYPIYLYQLNIGVWELVPHNHLFGTEIKNEEELASFAQKYASV